MTDRLSTILMTSPGIFGPGIQRWLLEKYNCSLGNNLPASKADSSLMIEFPEAKHIIPVFGYKESWDRMFTTFEEWQEEITFREPGTEFNNNLYYYNCGAGAWNGLDEPGTRGSMESRQINFGRALQEVKMTELRMPGLRSVVTHPFPQTFTDERIPSDVWAWGLPYIMQQGATWREKLNIPDDKEIWCYLINQDLNDPIFNLADVGKVCRDLGLSACLIYKAEHPALMDMSNPDPRTWMTAKARGLLEGMVNA